MVDFSPEKVLRGLTGAFKEDTFFETLSRVCAFFDKEFRMGIFGFTTYTLCHKCDVVFVFIQPLPTQKG